MENKAEMLNYVCENSKRRCREIASRFKRGQKTEVSIPKDVKNLKDQKKKRKKKKILYNQYEKCCISGVSFL